TYNNETAPSVFTGSLGESVAAVFKNIGKRFTFGGEPPLDQRVYYFNTKELVGNKYGTASPIPLRIVDTNIGLDLDTAVRCFGEYSFHISNPILFYTNVCGNVESAYTRDTLESQMKTELLTALQPAFAKISDLGIRYSAIPAHTKELADLLNTELSADWQEKRGMEIVSFGISSMTIPEQDEAMIKDLQRSATMRDPTMAAAHLTAAQAEAMKAAAANEGAGPAMAFMGMNMAANAGGTNAQTLFQMGRENAQAAAAAAPAPAGMTCPHCGAKNVTGKFCPECGKPLAADGWTCPKCGKVNKGKFCAECGEKKPEGLPKYKCDKCGWEPEDPYHPPKFCPECGDPFDENDAVN
ncbi:MAG: SPFH domain-containing protein, partial [Oscillospiraceae bacterium]|nr:SPFH domain-containing protein [Oscillospiraceae bacterium]